MDTLKLSIKMEAAMLLNYGANIKRFIRKKLL